MRFAAGLRMAMGAVLAAGVMSATALAAGKVCDVKTYGAKGDGTTKDTAAVQKAIDECSAGRGGGTVEGPAGTYLIAPVSLKSNMTLHLAKDATLLGSPDREEYPKVIFARHPTVQPLVGS